MYFCRRCEAARSQSPLEPPECEVKGIAAATAAHFVTRLEKFAERRDGLTGSPASPSQRLEACSSGAVAAPRRPQRAEPCRPRPSAQGSARHVLPAVWIPLLLGSPGKRSPAPPRPPQVPVGRMGRGRGGVVSDLRLPAASELARPGSRAPHAQPLLPKPPGKGRGAKKIRRAGPGFPDV